MKRLDDIKAYNDKVEAYKKSVENLELRLRNLHVKEVLSTNLEIINEADEVQILINDAEDKIHQLLAKQAYEAAKEFVKAYEEIELGDD